MALCVIFNHERSTEISQWFSQWRMVRRTQFFFLRCCYGASWGGGEVWEHVLCPFLPTCSAKHWIRGQPPTAQTLERHNNVSTETLITVSNGGGHIKRRAVLFFFSLSLMNHRGTESSFICEGLSITVTMSKCCVKKHIAPSYCPFSLCLFPQKGEVIVTWVQTRVERKEWDSQTKMQSFILPHLISARYSRVKPSEFGLEAVGGWTSDLESLSLEFTFLNMNYISHCHFKCASIATFTNTFK